MADGQVVFEITADGKHAIANIKDVTKAIQQESKKWDKAADQASGNIETSFMAMVKKVTAGITAAQVGRKILDWGKAAVEAASDLEEVQNVVDVTFGDGAKQIEVWAKSAGKNFGLTETQAKKFTSTLGAMMKSAGMSGDEIIGMSTDLAGLAADMASFYNLDFETAFQKIRSGISGETEPLKQLGINMSVANLEAYALRKGITTAFNSMTQGEQTMLRYQYMMQATADAQGDFSRTADGFANASRRVESAVESINTKIGQVFLPMIGDAMSGIAEFLEKVTEEPEETLFDKVNAIDIETEQKLADIGKVADQAENLIGKLGIISGSDAGDALGALASGANKLNAGSPSTWKALFNSLQSIDGLQNLFGTSGADKNIEGLANALSGASVDADKAEAWKTFLGALSDNADAVSKLTGSSIEETKAWLEGLSEAVNSIDAGDADAWNNLLNTLVSGFSADTPEGQKFVEGLASQFLAMGSDSETAAKGLEALGFTSTQIADKQSEWLKVCKQLVQTIPGLSEVINTETGEVKGGVGALEQYVQEWQTSQEKLLRWKAYYAKKSALAETQGNLYSMEIESGGAQYALDRYLAENDNRATRIYNQYGAQALSKEGNSEEKTRLMNLLKDAKESRDRYNTALEQSAELTEQLANEEAYLTETYGELTDAETEAGNAAQESGKQTSVAWEQSKAAVNEAIQALQEYVQQAHDATARAVDGVVNGFDRVQRAGDDLRKKSSEYAGKEVETLSKYNKEFSRFTDKSGVVDLVAMGKDWDNLSSAEKTAYNALVDVRNAQKEVNDELAKYSAGGVTAGLQDQLDYMNEYLDNLEKARELGLSDELLASLSDGSAKSAEYLSGLLSSGMTPEDVEKLNSLYDQVQSRKEEFANALTDQQLKVDETYQAMVDKAKSAIDEMNLQGQAADAMGMTVSGLAQGINSRVGEVASAVNAVIAQLERLSSYNVNLNFGPLGSMSFALPFVPDGSHALGLDYVPFNGYLAELHEGEGVLTAEENRIWQRFRNGDMSSRNVDYDALGATMRDNVKPGGDVYLDGRVVGSVISAQQGRSYRTLQRSGWQS